MLLRALASGGEPAFGSVIILAAYTVVFFYLGGRLVKRTE
jgi:hypothetical protein